MADDLGIDLIFVDFKQKQPIIPGYYLIHYLHKDDKVYHKCIWWNNEQKAFIYKDYVKEVYGYVEKPYKYYCPCMAQDDSWRDTIVEPV